MDRFFFRIYRTITKHKAFSIVAFLLVLTVLAFVASKITFEEDISKLIPTNSKTAEIQQVLKSVNFTDKIIVNIKIEKGGTVEDLIEYATQYIDSTSKNYGYYIKNIQGKVADDDILGTLEFVYENLPVFLEKEDYQAIGQKINADSIQAITEANYKTLLSPSGIVAKNTLLKDPLGISFIALKRLKQLDIGDDFKLKDGFLLTKNDENILLFITPKFGSSETAQNTKFAESLYKLQDGLNENFKGKAQSEYFGATLIAVANANQIKRDIQFTVGIALFLLIIILIFFYRKIWIPLVLFVPTAFGGLLAIAFLYFFRGQVSAISLGIGSVLLGVTLDYSLHILTHIRNNESIKNLYKDVAEPILMSSLTTALAFLCLLFLDSQALQDLGIFAAVSVLGASFFALLFIPFVYKNPQDREIKLSFLDKLAAHNYHKNKWILGILAICLILSAFTYGNVIFNKDISKLNFEPTEIVKAKENLDALTDLSSKSIYIATYGKSTEETLQKNDSIYKLLEKLKAEGKILSYSNIGALVHSKKTQRQKITNWQQFWDSETIDTTKFNLVESGNVFGFKPTTFTRFYELLESDFQPILPEDYQVLPSVILEDYITTEADFTTVTSLVKLDNANATAVKSMFRGIPKILVIDRQEMNETFLGGLKNDFNHLIIYCSLVVLFILFLFFRSFSLTLVTVIPIFLTWFMTIGIMGLFHIEFNIFNIIISTFIFGLGIDYSIFVTKGLLKELQIGEPTLNTHKTSIILSVITTILGVGALIFAKHPALHSISLVSIIGIFSAMLMSFTVQPLLFKLFIGGKNNRPVTPRMFLHSVISFCYFGIGGILLSLYSVSLMRILPLSKKIKMGSFHKAISTYMKSVLYTNPFVKKKIINENNEDFSKPAVIIANHTSFLDILSIGMLHPKICFLVNDWVYNSPVFGKAVQLADFYPVSSGIDNSIEHLRKKVKQGYSLMAFPEGTRSTTNKIKRFHKGAFFLAGQFELDILPVLIHGNSEINPKGSFTIKDGNLTLKILPRIKAEDVNFGRNYTERAKKVGGYFKEEFLKLRSELENETYFQSTVLEEYRYKGDNLYRKAKRDLNDKKAIYHHLISEIGKTETVVHFSNKIGVLDFLLNLDGPDRRIFSFIEDTQIRQVLQNSYLTSKSSKLQFVESAEELLKTPSKLLIVDFDVFSEAEIARRQEILAYIQKNEVETIFSLGEIDESTTEKLITLGFHKSLESPKLGIFKKEKEAQK